MNGEYQKFDIEMKRETENYRLWKRGADECSCRLESYKDKRSICFTAENLLPSLELQQSENREYHLLLLGQKDGEILYKDFGNFKVGSRGDGRFFKKFGGAELSCYSHCLFVVTGPEEGTIETVFSGETPFYEEQQEGFGWKRLFAEAEGKGTSEVFSENTNETGAEWYRFQIAGDIPAPLCPYRSMMETYGHCILGKREKRRFIGIPGRFLQAEQPEGFTLWQPIKGGEAFFSDLTTLTGKLQEEIFGYWIGEVDIEEGKVFSI